MINTIVFVVLVALYFGVGAVIILGARGKLPTKARARHRARMARWAVEQKQAHQEEVRRKLDEALAEFRTKVAEWDARDLGCSCAKDPEAHELAERGALEHDFDCHADEALELVAERDIEAEVQATVLEFERNRKKPEATA